MKTNLVFSNGEVFHSEIQCLLFPLNPLLCIINPIIENNEEKEIIKILYNNFNIDSEIMIEKYKKYKLKNILYYIIN